MKPGAVRSPPSIISLMNGPGESTFTRTFHGAHSCAMLLVRFRSAAFDAPYAQTPAPPEYAAIVPMFTMLPPPWSRMIGETHWLMRSGPSRFTENTLRQYVERHVRGRDARRVDAGVVDEHVDAPKRSTTVVDEAGDRVPLADVAREPEGVAAGRVGDLARRPASQRSCLRLLTTTDAPAPARPAAMARPMPLVEPVTIATLPVRSNSEAGDVIRP